MPVCTHVCVGRPEMWGLLGLGPARAGHAVPTASPGTGARGPCARAVPGWVWGSLCRWQVWGSLCQGRASGRFVGFGSLCQGCARVGFGGPCAHSWGPSWGPSPLTGLGGSSMGAPGPVALLGLWFLCGAGLSLPPSQPCVCSSLGAGGGPGEARAGCGCGACNPLGPGAQLCCSTLLSPQPPDGSPPGTGTHRGCIHPSPLPGLPREQGPRDAGAQPAALAGGGTLPAHQPPDLVPERHYLPAGRGPGLPAARWVPAACCPSPRPTSAGANPRAGVRIVPTSRDL